MRMDEDDSEEVSEESEDKSDLEVLVVCQVHLMMQNQNCELLYAIAHYLISKFNSLSCSHAVHAFKSYT